MLHHPHTVSAALPQVIRFAHALDHTCRIASSLGMDLYEAAGVRSCLFDQIVKRFIDKRLELSASLVQHSTKCNNCCHSALSRIAFQQKTR